jgi:hypothetical protein
MKCLQNQTPKLQVQKGGMDSSKTDRHVVMRAGGQIGRHTDRQRQIDRAVRQEH